MLRDIIIRFLQTIFHPNGPGWIPDEVDPRDANYSILFGAPSETLPKSVNHLSELKLKRQGAAPFCFLPDTEILLEDFSLRKIKDMKIGEVVVTHAGNRKKVIQLFRRDWQGNLFEIISYGSYKKLICTPEHPLYVFRDEMYQFILAKELKETDFLVVPLLSGIQKDCVTKEIYRDTRFLELLGWYLAEGSVELQRKDKNGSRLAFSLGGNEMDFAKRISDLTNELYRIEGIIRKNKHNGIVVEYGGKKILEEMLSEMGGIGAENKKIHSSLMFLPPKLQLEIVKSWFLGDGHFGEVDENRSTNHLSGVSISKTLVEQIRLILLRNGIKSSITYRKAKIYEGESVKTRRDAYDVHVYGNEAKKVFPEKEWAELPETVTSDSRMKIDGNNLLCKVRSINKSVPNRRTNEEEKINHHSKSYVYNLEVEDDNTYIANGYSVHNCVSFGATHIQARNQKVLDGWTVDLSPRFLASRGKTSPRGANIRTVLEILRTEGCVLESECPFFPDNFRWSSFWNILNVSFLTADMLERGKRNKIAGYARIDPWNKQVIKRAMQSGPVLFGLYLGSNWNWGGVVQTPKSFGLGHVVVGAGYDDDRGSWIVGDSLEPQQKYVSYNYPIASCWVLTDLPDNYRELQAKSLADQFPFAIKELYGEGDPQLLKSLLEERAKELALGIKKYTDADPRLGGAFGTLWHLFAVAYAFGGWTAMPDLILLARRYAENGTLPLELNSKKL